MPTRIFLLETLPSRASPGSCPFLPDHWSHQKGFAERWLCRGRGGLWEERCSPQRKGQLCRARATLTARSAWQGKRLFISSAGSQRAAAPKKVHVPFSRESSSRQTRSGRPRSQRKCSSIIRKPERTNEPFVPGCLSSVLQEAINKTRLGASCCTEKQRMSHTLRSVLLFRCHLVDSIQRHRPATSICRSFM